MKIIFKYSIKSFTVYNLIMNEYNKKEKSLEIPFSSLQGEGKRKKRGRKAERRNMPSLIRGI